MATLCQLRQAFVITALNGDMDTARELGEQYQEETRGLEGRL